MISRVFSVFILFSVPPRIEDAQSSSDKVRTEGSDVSLECHATGSPDPVVTWKREDGHPINIDKANNISGENQINILKKCTATAFVF